MFACRVDAPTIDNYSAAVRFFNDMPQHKNWTDGHKPLGRTDSHKRKTHMGMFMRKGSVVFQLYDFEALIYNPDGSLEISGYSTRSTMNFIKAITPHYVWLTDDNESYVLWLRTKRREGGEWWRDYMVGHALRDNHVRVIHDEDGELWQADPAYTRPHVDYRLDAKKAAAARVRYRYAEFCDMLRVMERIRPNGPECLKFPLPSEVVEQFMRGKSGWDQLMAWLSPEWSSSAARWVLDGIYTEAGAVNRTKVPVVTSLAQRKQLVSRGARYRSLYRR